MKLRPNQVKVEKFFRVNPLFPYIFIMKEFRLNLIRSTLYHTSFVDYRF